MAILGVPGVTAIELSMTPDPVERTILAVPDFPPELAVMIAFPPVSAVTKPLLETVAAVVFDELQLTVAVKFWLLPSE